MQASALQQRRCCPSAIWGKHWHRNHIFYSKQTINEAVINALGTKSFKDTSLMNVLHCLFFFQAYYSFLYTASHIDNTLADAPSCNNATVFLSKVPNVDKTNPC